MRALAPNALLASVLAALTGLASGAGCSSSSSTGSSQDSGSPGASGASCSINSDCVDPLVCTYAHCHSACEETRDCPAGSRCVLVNGLGVCELPVETSCGTASCPGSLVCGPDQTCRNACSPGSPTDCLGNQICQAGVCYDPGEVDAGAAGDAASE